MPAPTQNSPSLRPVGDQPEGSSPRSALRIPRLIRRCLWLLALCSLLFALGYVFRSPLLTGLAHAWIINDQPQKADAIVVLGGGLEYRPFEAARLYTNGLAPKILIAQPELPPTAELGLTVPEFVTARKVLLQLGVPESAIEMIGTNVTSTRDEALAVRAWVEQNHAGSVIIPTDIFHTRRARWIFRKALRAPVSDSALRTPHSALESPPSSNRPSSVVSGPLSRTPCEVHLLAITLPRYNATNWWQHEDGLIAFQNEVVKDIFYHWNY